jgi:hypothetical protein
MSTEKKFDYDYFDTEGNLNKSSLNMWKLSLFIISTIIIFLPYTFIFAFIVSGTNPFPDSDVAYTNIIIMLEFMLLDGFTHHQLIYLSLAIALAYYLYNLRFGNIKFKATTQRKLYQMGLSQYSLTKFDNKKKIYTFSLSKGGSMNYNGFISNVDNIKQLFQVGKLKASRNEIDKVVLEFLAETPQLTAIKDSNTYTIEEMDELVADGAKKKDFKIKSNCKRTNFEESIEQDMCIFGTQDIEGKPLYASFPQTTGFIQGHMLVAGGTGSGKSYATSNIVKQMFHPKTYGTLDEIVIINMKEDSSDWDFLKGINKVTLGTGLEDALAMLKELELKMLANNRWNSLNGKENTDFGQTILIIDEIHKFFLIAKDSTQPKYVRAMAEKCIQIIDTLATQSRSANLFVIGVLQKATLNLISDVFRSQCMNRFLLKADKTTSYIVIDKEIQDEKMIDSKRLSAGQFIYHNLQNNIMKEGFAVEVVKDEDFNVEEINKLSEPEKLIKGREESKRLKDLAAIVAELKAEDYKKKEEDKNFKEKIASYKSRKSEKKDYWAIAEAMYNEEQDEDSEDIKEESTSEIQEEKLNIDKKPKTINKRPRAIKQSSKKESISDSEVKSYEARKEAMKKRLLRKSKIEEEANKNIEIDEKTIEDIEVKAKESISKEDLEKVEEEVKKEWNKENIQHSEDLTF